MQKKMRTLTTFRLAADFRMKRCGEEYNFDEQTLTFAFVINCTLSNLKLKLSTFSVIHVVNRNFAIFIF